VSGVAAAEKRSPCLLPCSAVGGVGCENILISGIQQGLCAVTRQHAAPVLSQKPKGASEG
jgi:hypothetical protein